MRRIKEEILKFLIYFSAVITVSALVWITAYILFRGLGHITYEFLFSMPKGSGADGGIFSIIVITLLVAGLGVAISTPVGICSAIYLAEYAKPGRLVRVIRFATECLSGIPSIIFGLFGMVFFVTMLKFNFSILSGALTLSIMVLPVVIRTTEEALKSVSVSYREGSLALGASKFRTIFKTVIPSSINGIVAAAVLSIGRIAGETAAVLLTSGTVRRLPENVFDGGRTLAVHLYILAKEGISLEKSFATASVLIIVVAIINSAANALGRRLSKACSGKRSKIIFWRVSDKSKTGINDRKKAA